MFEVGIINEVIKTEKIIRNQEKGNDEILVVSCPELCLVVKGC